MPCRRAMFVRVSGDRVGKVRPHTHDAWNANVLEDGLLGWTQAVVFERVDPYDDATVTTLLRPARSLRSYLVVGAGGVTLVDPCGSARSLLRETESLGRLPDAVVDTAFHRDRISCGTIVRLARKPSIGCRRAASIVSTTVFIVASTYRQRSAACVQLRSTAVATFGSTAAASRSPPTRPRRTTRVARPTIAAPMPTTPSIAARFSSTNGAVGNSNSAPGVFTALTRVVHLAHAEDGRGDAFKTRL